MKRSFGNSTGSASITATSPTRTSRARLVAVRGADVDVQVLELRDPLAVVVLHQVDRLLADHARDAPGARRDRYALADEDDRVPAADAGEPQEPVVVDVVDDQADLVDVPDDRDRPAAAGPGHARDGGADGVVGDLGEGGRGLAEHGRGRLLVARRPGRGQELVERLWHPHGDAGL